MEDYLRIEKMGEKYTVRVYSKKSGFRKKSKDSTSYYNVVDKNPLIIAQVLLDLDMIEGFPIEKAITIYKDKKNNRDWMGLST